jgi:seryl-tRNA synthetase
MLQTAYIRDNKEEVIARLAKRNFDATQQLENILQADNKRREIQTQNDDLLAQQNAIAKQIGELFKSGKAAEANGLKEKTAALKEQSSQLTVQLAETEDELRKLLLQIPNAPHQSVPKGKSAEDNETMETVGEIPTLHTKAIPHWELADKYDLIDFKLGVKITGAGFPVYKGKGAKLQRALINFFLDEATKAGYAEVQPPLLVNEDSGYGTGQLPDKEGQMYHVGVDNLYLIPTAEVPITNLHRDLIYKADDLPIKQTGYTPCFRREAGSYGKDVKGLNRLHQFDKVEIVQIQLPEKSYETLEQMRDYVAGILKKLDLPFRVLKLCGGDMGFASAMTYDFEVFSSAQKMWLEVSSVSNFETFQANRLKLRYKDSNGKTQLCHTLNGSALALPRIVASLLENNQDENGIKIPAVLQPYTGFERND